MKKEKRKYFWLCVDPSTNTSVEFHVYAYEYKQAKAELERTRGKLIPLEYLGWQEVHEVLPYYKTTIEERIDNLQSRYKTKK